MRKNNLQENKKNLEKGEQVYEEVTKFTPINKFDIFSKALEFVEDIDTAKKIADIVCKTLKNENMAINEQDKVDEIKKSLENEIRESSKQIEAKTTELVTNANEQFSKGISEIKDMFSEFKKGIEEKFENIERQSLGRKSVVTSRALEKSFGGEEQANAASGKTVVSISRQRGQVSSILMAKSGIEKGEVNDFYVNEITKFEATGQISKAAMDDLNVNSNIDRKSTRLNSSH